MIPAKFRKAPLASYGRFERTEKGDRPHHSAPASGENARCRRGAPGLGPHQAARPTALAWIPGKAGSGSTKACAANSNDFSRSSGRNASRTPSSAAAASAIQAVPATAAGSAIRQRGHAGAGRFASPTFVPASTQGERSTTRTTGFFLITITPASGGECHARSGANSDRHLTSRGRAQKGNGANQSCPGRTEQSHADGQDGEDSAAHSGAAFDSAARSGYDPAESRHLSYRFHSATALLGLVGVIGNRVYRSTPDLLFLNYGQWHRSDDRRRIEF